MAVSTEPLTALERYDDVTAALVGVTRLFLAGDAAALAEAHHVLDGDDATPRLAGRLCAARRALVELAAVPKALPKVKAKPLVRTLRPSA